MPKLVNSYSVEPPAGGGGGGGSLVDFLNCKLLMHFNGSNGSTTIVDDSSYAHTVTTNGIGSLDTSEKKFGTASFGMPTSAEGITANHSADYNVGSSATDFSIEFWHYDISTINTNHILASKYAFTSLEPFTIRVGTNNKLSVLTSDNAGGTQVSLADPGTITRNAWRHYAYCNKGGTFYLYNHGTMVASATPSAFTFGDNSGQVYINGGGMQGWVDDFRLVIGESAYDGSDFTPPTAEFPNS